MPWSGADGGAFGKYSMREELVHFSHNHLVPALMDLREKLKRDLHRELQHLLDELDLDAGGMSKCSTMAMGPQGTEPLDYPALAGYLEPEMPPPDNLDMRKHGSVTFDTKDVVEVFSRQNSPEQTEASADEDDLTASEMSKVPLLPHEPHMPFCNVVSDEFLTIEDEEELTLLLEGDLIGGVKPVPLASQLHRSLARLLQGGVGFATLVSSHRRLRTWTAEAVQSTTWDILVTLLVVSNAVLIGMEVDFKARNLGAPLPHSYEVADNCWCALFMGELITKLWALGWAFFHESVLRWNLFDCFVNCSQLLCRTLVAVGGLHRDSDIMESMSFLRIVRLLRLLRIIRVVRLLHVIVELRSMIVTIIASLRSLFWGLLLIFGMIFVISIFILQTVTDQRVRNGEAILDDEATDRFFSSLGSLIVSLWASITGGVQWSHMMDPLMHVSPVTGLVFMLYIAFSILALMNVMTGIFVEQAMKTARADEEQFVAVSVAKYFNDKLFGDGASADLPEAQRFITWEDFNEHIERPELQDLFTALNVDPREARSLYQLIDRNQIGMLTGDQLTTGWVRLQGSAKAVDLALHTRKFEVFLEELWERIGNVQQAVDCIHLQGITPPDDNTPHVRGRHRRHGSKTSAGASVGSRRTGGHRYSYASMA
eukprot:TRINITY_DN101990_c0_g1_i1.p1 TRINITY_DN101990_c0_g1~~TRINITY_DN101990_c0_g1_i1.p1  ORF type:complete len:654 (+),score=130.26 TRINITY_DN101990_c0_g1_i1:100-2061(+)